MNRIDFLFVVAEVLDVLAKHPDHADAAKELRERAKRTIRKRLELDVRYEPVRHPGALSAIESEGS